MTNAILAIDLQNDFVKADGSLSVPGAEGDVKRVSSFIRNNAKDIHHISATLDSHHPIHIANAIFWKDVNGNHPAPFTVITLKDVKEGKWQTAFNPQWAVHYVEELEKLGKTLTIWTNHCIVGSEGFALHNDFMNAMVEWEELTYRPYHLEFKGSNWYSEHYSIFKAEVEVPNCPETQINQNLINILNKYDRVFLFGQAANVCVKNSLNDLNNYAPDLVKKLVILEDCMSPIGNWDINTDPVYQKAVSLGAKIMKSIDVNF